MKRRTGVGEMRLVAWFDALSVALLSLPLLAVFVSQKSPLAAKISELLLPILAATLLAPPAGNMIASLVGTNQIPAKTPEKQ